MTLGTVIHDDSVSIHVRDTRQGIDIADASCIFDPFVQINKLNEPGSTGLGLGLALVSELVQLHGGSIQVHSEGLGKGSTLTLTLPVLPGVAVHEISADSQPPSTTFSGLDIVVTDDNLDSIRALGRLLERRGHRVRLAATGQEALEALAHQVPDVLLLDIGLPDISGHQVAMKVRQTYPQSNLLLIATTGYGQAKDRLRSADAGFDHHLVKPMNLDTLYGLLQAHSEEYSLT